VTELRVHLLLAGMQPQFAAFLGTPTRARGYPPCAGQHPPIVEVASALAIERVIDLALRAVPGIEPGILFVERQFGVLDLHAADHADVVRWSIPRPPKLAGGPVWSTTWHGAQSCDVVMVKHRARRCRR